MPSEVSDPTVNRKDPNTIKAQDISSKDIIPSYENTFCVQRKQN